jgi:hypothetical protein
MLQFSINYVFFCPSLCQLTLRAAWSRDTNLHPGNLQFLPPAYEHVKWPGDTDLEKTYKMQTKRTICLCGIVSYCVILRLFVIYCVILCHIV